MAKHKFKTQIFVEKFKEIVEIKKFSDNFTKEDEDFLEYYELELAKALLYDFGIGAVKAAKYILIHEDIETYKDL